MNVKVETTPNPASLKFVIEEGSFYPGGTQPTRTFFIKGDPCLISPFARDILTIEGIQGIFFGKNFITITKLPSKNWDDLSFQLKEKIEKQLTDKKAFFIATSEQKIESNPKDLGITKQIIDVLETRVRPFVQEDGGDIAFHSFQDGIVFVRLLGACEGCPSSFVTLKNGVERLLQHYVPEVKTVQAVGYEKGYA